jgi:hypothetical protein
VSDYTSLGVDKIAHQATRDASLIRCPRDSVVMRVLGSRAERLSREGMVSREFTRLPSDAAWRLVEVDVECPACRRRACGVRLPRAAATAPVS